MVSNGHFAAVGDDWDGTEYKHGIQLIDEDKEFKYVTLNVVLICRLYRPGWREYHH